MDEKPRHDTAGSAISSSDDVRALEFTFEEFEQWLRSEWRVLKWHHEDWRETQDPKHVFVIDWGRDVGWDRDEVEGYVPDDKSSIHWRGQCSADFVLEFVRKFMIRFPTNADHVIFHDGDCGISVYRPGLTDDELYDCITGKLYTLDNEFQRRVFGDVRSDDIAEAVAERARMKQGRNATD